MYSLSVLRKEADYFEMCFSKCDSFTQPQAKQENWILKSKLFSWWKSRSVELPKFLTAKATFSQHTLYFTFRDLLWEQNAPKWIFKKGVSALNGFGHTELNQIDGDKFPDVTVVSLLSSGLAAFFSMCFQLLPAFIPKPLPLSTALHWRKFYHFSREVLPSFYLLPYLLCQMPRCAHVPVSELTKVRFAHPHFLPFLTSSRLGCITCTSVREVRMHR